MCKRQMKKLSRNYRYLWTRAAIFLCGFFSGLMHQTMHLEWGRSENIHQKASFFFRLSEKILIRFIRRDRSVEKYRYSKKSTIIFVHLGSPMLTLSPVN